MNRKLWIQRFDVMGDIVLSTAAQQYGGFTVPEVDKILAPYAKKSYDKYVQEFLQYSDKSWTGREEKAIEYALDKVRRDFDQGWQGIEYKLNTVGSSRGDYPFVTVTLGLGTGQFEKMCNISLLEVHKGGQGRDGHKNRFFSRKSYFFMMKIFMDRDSAVRMYLRQVWTVLQRQCIRTGFPCQERVIFPVCISSTER